MKQITKQWLLLGKDDISVARLSLDNKHYLHALFLCQQALEKGLKAVIAAVYA